MTKQEIEEKERKEKERKDARRGERAATDQSLSLVHIDLFH